MTEEHPFIDDATIAAYLDGVLSPDEVVCVEHAVARDAQFAEALEGMRGILKASIRYPQWDTKQLWSAFTERSGLGDGIRVASPGLGYRVSKERVFSRRTLRRGVWSAAAVVLAGVVAVVGWNLVEQHAGRRAATSMMTYTTGNGERATIALPDGGTVALNVASRLEVPMDYMSGHHTVRLVGEGLFTVSHHEGAPLTVLAGGTAARVLGTSFVVRHYATDTSAMVAVRDGKVAVGAMVVTANQLVEVGQSGVPHVRLSDGSPFTFATGTLTIDGLLLPAAIVELDRWYDTDIRLGDPALASRHVKATFEAGSLSDLSEFLGSLYDVRVVRDGRVLTLYPKR